MDILDAKIVTTRKEHHCYGCARKFPKGSRLQVVTSVDGGEIGSAYWCPTCQAYWQKHMEYGDLIAYGELKQEDSEGWEEVRKEVEEVENETCECGCGGIYTCGNQEYAT